VAVSIREWVILCTDGHSVSKVYIKQERSISCLTTSKYNGQKQIEGRTYKQWTAITFVLGDFNV